MKIVTLSSKDIFGGAAKAAYRLHKYFLDQGLDELLLVNNKKSRDITIKRASDFYSKKGSFHKFIDKFILRFNEWRRVRKWRLYPNRENKVFMDQEVSLLRNALDALDFDLLHLHWVGESFVNFTEFEKIDTPVVWTLHDCFAFTGICTYFETCTKYITHCNTCPQLRSTIEKDISYEVFEQKLHRYRNIDFHIVCPSNWMAQHVQKSALLGKYPVAVIPNGIDTEFFYPISKIEAKLALGFDPQKKIILFGGISINSDSRKGGQLLLRALEELKSFYTDYNQVELLVFGADTNDFSVDYKTTYLGYLDNDMFIRIAYSAADVTILPSMHENLPTVIMESMSCGTPVVAFNIGGNGDMIDHMENGYLAEPYDTKELAKGLKYCFDENNNEQLKNNARQKILNNFKIQDIGQRYLQLYKDILNKER